MDKKILFLCVPLLSFVHSFAQVGINTTEPQQALHVSGISNKLTAPYVGTTNVKVIEPTIKIEGLSADNNTAHDNSPNSIKRVYANRDGDLMLRKGNSNYLLINETTIPISSTYVTVKNEISRIALKSNTFTIEKESIVTISASVATRLENTTNDQLTLPEENECDTGISLMFTAAPDASLVGKEFSLVNFNMLTKQIIIERTNPVIETHKTLLLDPGTYTFNLMGVYSGAIARKAVFGIDSHTDPNKNYIKVLAIPTNKK